jgi:hypothetical protein
MFCNGTGKEEGQPDCVWCDNTGKTGHVRAITAATHEAFTVGTGVMKVSSEGVEHVPLKDMLKDLKPFRLLPYGTKFRYQGLPTVFVCIGHNLIAQWPATLFSSDGTPRQSLCIFCHLEGDEDGNTLDTLVEVVDQDSELAALREELAKSKAQLEHWHYLDLQRDARLTAAEQRYAAVQKLSPEAYSVVIGMVEHCLNIRACMGMDEGYKDFENEEDEHDFVREIRAFVAAALAKPTESGASHVDCGQCPNITDGCLGTCQRSKP